MTSRENSLLPVDDAREAALFFVVSALCFLAALAALGARSTYGAARAWTAEVEGEYTLTLPSADETSLNAAAMILREVTGVAEAKPLGRDEITELLAPTFGARGLPADLPAPGLIAVTGRPEAGNIASSLSAALASAGYEASVDSHAEWASDVRRMLARLRLMAFSVVLLLASTAVAVIASATHAALLARRDIVDVLHVAGADDRFIARLFERRFWLLGLRAGTVGALLALVTAAIVVFLMRSDKNRTGLLPELSLDMADLAILVMTPLLAGLASRIATRITLMRALKSMI